MKEDLKRKFKETWVAALKIWESLPIDEKQQGLDFLEKEIENARNLYKKAVQEQEMKEARKKYNPRVQFG